MTPDKDGKRRYADRPEVAASENSYTPGRLVREYLRTKSVRKLVFESGGLAAIAAASIYIAASLRWGAAPRDLMHLAAAGYLATAVAVLVAELGFLFAVATFGDEDLILIMQATPNNLWNTVVLQFSYYAMISAVAVLAGLLLVLSPFVQHFEIVVNIVAGIAFVLFWWMLVGVLLCGRTVVQYTQLRADFIRTVGPK